MNASVVLEHQAGRPAAGPGPDGSQPDQLAQARPRLRRDVIFADAGDGVFLHHRDNGYMIKGKTAYQWVSTLSPYLDGTRTVAELCEGLSGERRAMVADIVSSLLDRGFARNAAPEDPGILPGPVAERFAAQVNYIDHWADQPCRRFLRFRGAKVLVAGHGPASLAAAAGLLRNGLQTVYLAQPAAPDAIPAELAAEAAALTRAGCQASVMSAKYPAPGSGAPGYDIVLALGDSLGLPALMALTRSRAAGGPALLPAVTIGRHVVLGPLTRPRHAPCWACAMLRVSTNAAPEVAADLWRDIGMGVAPDGPGLPPALGHMIGNMLAFDVFRFCTGALPAETEDAIVVQDTDTLESVRDRLLPHPCCPCCGGGPAAVIEPSECLRDRAELGDEEILTRQGALFGRYGGVFQEYADIDATQAPVKIGSIRTGPAGRAGSRTRTSAAFDLHSVFAARIRAFGEAAAAYVDEVMAAPGAVTAVAARPDDRDLAAAVPAQELATWSGLPGPADGPWVPAASLTQGGVRYLPAAAVYPYAPVNHALVFERTSAGTGCGVTAAEAVRQGLLSALTGWAIGQAASGRCTVTEWLVAADADKELGFLLRAMRQMDLGARLLVLETGAPVSVVVAVGEETGAGPVPGRLGALWSAGAALSLRDACATALRDLVGTCQLASRPGEHAGSARGLASAALPDFDPRTLRGASPVGPFPRPQAPPTAKDILGWFRSTGRDAWVADTTTPDLRTAGFTTVRVVMSR